MVYYIFHHMSALEFPFEGIVRLGMPNGWDGSLGARYVLPYVEDWGAVGVGAHHKFMYGSVMLDVQVK